MAQEITYEELIEGMNVIDSDGDSAVVIDKTDIHNVRVSYWPGGKGLFCLSPNCEQHSIEKLYHP